jgi:hypothetical protein
MSLPNAATLMPDGWIYLSSGRIPRTGFFTVYNPFGNSNAACWAMAPSFDIVAEDLTAGNNYIVEMAQLRSFDGSGLGNYPKTYADIVENNRKYQTILQAGTDGRITGRLSPSTSKRVALRSHTDYFLDSGSYTDLTTWSDDTFGPSPDPSQYMEGKVSEAGGIKDVETPWGVRRLMFLKHQVRYSLSLKQSNGLYIKGTNITIEYGLASDLNRGSSTTSMAIDDFVAPVDFGLQSQFWTPVLDQNCNQPVPSEPFGYTDLIKRDFATADTRNLHIHTLEIFCEKDPLNETYFLCNDTQSHALTVNGVTQTFQAANFSFTLPQTTEDSTPEMQLTISNVDGVAGEYVDRVRGLGRLSIRYRVYLASDTTQPQNPNPLTLYLTEANVDMFQISGRLSLTDSLDARFPSENYNVKNFPNIFG